MAHETNPKTAWLLDRNARASFMRASALHGLVVALVRAEVPTPDALAILAAELGASRRRRVDPWGDVARLTRWTTGQLVRARALDAAFDGAAFVVEGPPFTVTLALHRGSRAPAGYMTRITYQSPGRGLRLDTIARLLGRRAKDDARWIVPLAYAALIVRDALSRPTPSSPVPLRSVRVAYGDGDEIVLPSPRR